VLSLSACQTVQTTQAGAVGVDRTQSFMVSAASVNSSAAKAYQQVIGDAQKKGQLNRDPAQRRSGLESWITPLLPIRSGIAIVLRLLRESGMNFSTADSMGEAATKVVQLPG